MATRPNIAAAKQRLQEPAEEAPPQEAPKRVLPPDKRAELAAYIEAAENMNKAAPMVPLDELPESYKAAKEKEEKEAAAADDTFYSGTAVDNREVRGIIEGKCEEMDFADLVFTGRVTQKVPIIPGKLIAEYQSLTSAEGFWVVKNAANQATSDFAVRNWMGYARLAMSLVSLNGNDLPTIYVKGELSEKLFNEKLNSIMGMGEKIIQILVVNFGWFSTRVDRLIADDFDKLKNG